MLLGLPACELSAPALLTDLQRDVAACDSRYGGGPERLWRDCVHRAARQLLLPVVRLPDVYSLLLIEDKRLTEEILAGRGTVEARNRRLHDLAQRIELVEGGEPLATPAPSGQAYDPTADEIVATRTFLIEVLSR